MNMNIFLNVVEKLGGNIGTVVGHVFAAAQDAFELVIKTVLPFMAFVAILITFVKETGLGDLIAHVLTPLGDSLIGLVVLSAICGFPLIAPILSPGAAVAQVVGVTVGGLIGTGIIPPMYALPALFAINVQAAADSIPLMLSMQDAKPETIKTGVPALLISRQITGPIAVLIGYIFALGLY
ncbi:PTS glucitol/sorbitol transporter subunit IIB [Vibrio gazogenes]|uniref:Sorbitol phosphotransferase enzyme II C-terminus n=1 Tax=Vibrio gazogenes DSM 21264 = NBRC 103151 TaxID=1123492 RepID=A0A1M5BNR7_VIBGA|nr:PTS glucitol/sorbitol transporter subunit IIB [Vibrio gazogenes]USP13720.1 PTS glucitol/sorbitol transporter subunit IIB [Vibrio gazogenes]SHF44179.1 Sorbitol phosphotransferase enzyme II C-terminus [Vibrio gazogenes DSM 21264] [Vibrio gazogenes DSM 21264 = NBRC 103151]SJN55442.1 Glucitol/sorbitol-specific phosphotransferase enzyme IIB component [Vibrio gazogenes]